MASPAVNSPYVCVNKLATLLNEMPALHRLITFDGLLMFVGVSLQEQEPTDAVGWFQDRLVTRLARHDRPVQHCGRHLPSPRADARV